MDPFGLIGQVLDGQFRVDSFAGEGGFSAVYRGFHLGLREPIAIKCLKLPPALGSAIVESFVHRFRDESRLLYRLSQGNLHIVRCLACGTTMAPATGGLVPYMVLEWLEGRSMAQDFVERRARRVPGQSLEEMVSVLDSAVLAVAYAHAQGVVHRDLNPGNLFLAQTREGVKAKVLDFGVAKVVHDSLELGPRPATIGQIRVFAPAYGAPEQFDAAVGPMGPWTDVHGLALVALEAMRGASVVDGEHLGDFARAALSPERPTPRSLGLHVPPEVEGVFARATALSPQDRWQDAGEFWGAMKHAINVEKERVHVIAAQQTPALTLPKSAPRPVSSPPRPVSSPPRPLNTPRPAAGAPASSLGSTLAMDRVERPKTAPQEAASLGSTLAMDRFEAKPTAAAEGYSVSDATTDETPTVVQETLPLEEQATSATFGKFPPAPPVPTTGPTGTLFTPSRRATPTPPPAQAWTPAAPGFSPSPQAAVGSPPMPSQPMYPSQVHSQPVHASQLHPSQPIHPAHPSQGVGWNAGGPSSGHAQPAAPMYPSIPPEVPKSKSPVAMFAVVLGLVLVMVVGFLLWRRLGAHDPGDGAAPVASASAASSATAASTVTNATATATATANPIIDAPQVAPSAPVEPARVQPTDSASPESTRPSSPTTETRTTTEAPRPVDTSRASARQPSDAKPASDTKPTSRTVRESARSASTFPADAAKAKLDQIAGILASCKKPDGLTGRGKATVTFGNDGAPALVVVAPPFAGSREGECVIARFRTARIAPFEGEAKPLVQSFEIPK